eukprot:3063544-Amphidinium_carterae.1
MVVTSYSETEADLDSEVLDESVHCKYLWPPEANPYKSSTLRVSLSGKEEYENAWWQCVGC